jgi:hypothetical protein
VDSDLIEPEIEALQALAGQRRAAGTVREGFAWRN